MPDHDDHPALRRVLAPNPSPMTQRGTNTWIIGQDTVAVIDPGPADAAHLAAILGALGPDERISHILVTHAHRDHSALAPALQAASGAPVLAFGTARDGISPAMAALGPDAASGGEGVDAGFVPDQRLTDGAVISAPGWHIEAIHTPGHLGNHLCFGWEGRCFTGDHVMGWATSLVSPPEGDMGAYMASLRRLATRRWDAFLPGHGDMVTDPAARLAALIAHRLRREAEILAALDAGAATVPALTAAIYTDIAPDMRRAAERNVFAHLLDLATRMVLTASPNPGFAATFRRR